MQTVRSGTPTLLTQAADGIVSNVAGTLLGFYVNNTNAGTVVIYDGTSAAGGTAISGTITPAIGWREYPAYCPNGCFVDTGGTGLSVTFIFAAG